MSDRAQGAAAWQRFLPLSIVLRSRRGTPGNHETTMSTKAHAPTRLEPAQRDDVKLASARRLSDTSAPSFRFNVAQWLEQIDTQSNQWTPSSPAGAAFSRSAIATIRLEPRVAHRAIGLAVARRLGTSILIGRRSCRISILFEISAPAGTLWRGRPCSRLTNDERRRRRRQHRSRRALSRRSTAAPNRVASVRPVLYLRSPHARDSRKAASSA